MLHIRQSTSDLEHRPSWALTYYTNANGIYLGLRSELRRFAEWIFGPQGVVSLHLVAFGDFAYDGRKPGNNLGLCRNTTGGGDSNFYIVHEDDHFSEVFNDYSDVLGVCPMQPFLEVA